MTSVYAITEIIDSVRIEKSNNLINSICNLTQDGIQFGYSYGEYVNTSVFDYLTLNEFRYPLFVVRNRCEDLLSQLKETLIKGDILVNNKSPYSYIVSLTYHKIGEDTYEVLEENTIDLRYNMPFEDVNEDISCYQSEWISSTNKDCNLEYDVIYYSVFAITTSYHKDYWGEVDQDMDWEVLSHIQLDCSVDDFIEFRGLIPPVETFSGTGPIIF